MLMFDDVAVIPHELMERVLQVVGWGKAVFALQVVSVHGLKEVEGVDDSVGGGVPEEEVVGKRVVSVDGAK